MAVRTLSGQQNRRTTPTTGRIKPGRSVRYLFALVTLFWLILAAGALYAGLSYYRTPFEARAFSDLHERFRPAGSIGHGYGVVGSLMMIVGVLLYSTRKRWKRLERMGRLSIWLRVHIFLCTLGPFLVLLHTTFRFGGVVAISFWSMAFVTVSGIFGRYVYVRIPKSAGDRFASPGDLERRRNVFFETIAEHSGPAFIHIKPLLNNGNPLPADALGALLFTLSHGVDRRRRIHRIRHLLLNSPLDPSARARALDASRDLLSLQERIELLLPFQRMFRYWHVLHLPLAIVMFIIMFVHVAVAVLFGYTWIFQPP